MFRFAHFLLSLLFVLAAPAAEAGLIEGRVIEITDGATLTVLADGGGSLHRVRLAGIRTPGLNDRFGGQARESLRRLASGKPVRVDTSAMDEAGVLLGQLLIIQRKPDCGDESCEERIDPALRQLQAGLAVSDAAGGAALSPDTRARYASAEAAARVRKLGLWRVPAPRIRAETNYDESPGVFPLPRPDPLTGKR